MPPGPTGLRSRSASAASQAPSEGRESRSGSGTSTSNAYINKELLPAEFGRFYWLTYFGNYAVVYGVARNLWLAASPRAYYVASTLGFTMWPRFNRVTYHILRWPILVIVYAFVFAELLCYCALRLFVAFAEFAVATPKHRELRHALRHSKDYETWLACARALDSSKGVAVWQSDLRSTRYNWPFVKGLIAQLREARAADDWRAVAVALRLCSRPNVGGIMEPQLFSATHTGDPKLVVTDFVEEIAASVRWLTAYALASEDAACVSTARELLGAARESYGRTVLSLSGGGALGTYHFGVVRALLTEDMLPETICGTSAGSIISVFACCRTRAELEEDLYDDAKLVRYLRCFDRSPWACLKSFLKTGHAYDGGEWMDIAKWFANDRPEGVVDMTFAEAYARSKKKLAITVHAKGKRAPPVLLTHLTSPHVTIVSAVVATAAVPLLIAPQVLLEKDPETGVVAPQAGGEAYIDGSIVHDIPTVGLKEAFNAKFVVASQVNPHFQPMLYSTHGAAGEPCRWSPSFGALSSEDAWRGGFVLAALELYLRTDMVNKLKFLADIDASPGWSGKMFAQSFEGTITITPRLAPVDYLNLFSNPTPGNIGRYTREGRVATYQKMAMLRTRLSVERALNEGCDALRPKPALVRASSDHGFAGHGADRPRMRRLGGAGALDWATPSTISAFPNVDADPDAHCFDDDGL